MLSKGSAYPEHAGVLQSDQWEGGLCEPEGQKEVDGCGG